MAGGSVPWSRARRARAASLPVVAREARPAFEPLSLFEEVVWDYRSTDHSPRRHPLAPMRSELTARGLPDARAVAAMRTAGACATLASSSAASSLGPPKASPS